MFVCHLLSQKNFSYAFTYHRQSCQQLYNNFNTPFKYTFRLLHHPGHHRPRDQVDRRAAVRHPLEQLREDRLHALLLLAGGHRRQEVRQREHADPDQPGRGRQQEGKNLFLIFYVWLTI